MSFHPRNDVFSVLHALADLKRPRLLLRAARFGTLDYDRNTELRRILRCASTPAPGLGLIHQLIELEAAQNEARTRKGDDIGPPWRATRHVDILIALISEARLLTQGVEALPSR